MNVISLARRLLFATTFAGVVLLQADKEPAFALCNYAGASCFNPPSGLCNLSGPCYHSLAVDYFWDYQCPGACCAQGRCDVYERDPSENPTSCGWFCFADTYVMCDYFDCT